MLLLVESARTGTLTREVGMTYPMVHSMGCGVVSISIASLTLSIELIHALCIVHHASHNTIADACRRQCSWRTSFTTPMTASSVSKPQQQPQPHCSLRGPHRHPAAGQAGEQGCTAGCGIHWGGERLGQRPKPPQTLQLPPQAWVATATATATAATGHM
mgnify:CR=1 FL=1